MYILTYSTLSILLLYFGPGKAVFFHDSCAALMGFLVPEIQSIFTASGAPKELTSKPSGSSEFRSFMGLGVYMLGQEAESVYDDGFRYVANGLAKMTESSKTEFKMNQIRTKEYYNVRELANGKVPDLAKRDVLIACNFTRFKAFEDIEYQDKETSITYLNTRVFQACALGPDLGNIVFAMAVRKADRSDDEPDNLVDEVWLCPWFLSYWYDKFQRGRFSKFRSRLPWQVDVPKEVKGTLDFNLKTDMDKYGLLGRTILDALTNTQIVFDETVPRPPDGYVPGTWGFTHLDWRDGYKHGANIAYYVFGSYLVSQGKSWDEAGKIGKLKARRDDRYPHLESRNTSLLSL